MVTHELIQQRVQQVKDKVHDLNPIRRVKKLQYDETGANNPNVPGEDSGLNAWLDSQMNNDLTTDEQVQVQYAKKNSDKNRCFDIDDIPIKGPGNDKTHPIMMGKTKALAKKAKQLIDDDNISICRQTGVRFTKNARKYKVQGPVTQTRETGRNQEKQSDRGREQFEAEKTDTSFERERYNSDWEERDEMAQPYDDEFESDEWGHPEINTGGAYWEDTSPKRPVFHNPEPYDDEPFHFRPQTRRGPPNTSRDESQNNTYRRRDHYERPHRRSNRHWYQEND